MSKGASIALLIVTLGGIVMLCYLALEAIPS